MISIEASRKALGKIGKSMSDEEIEKLRSDMYELVNLALDSYVESKNADSI